MNNNTGQAQQTGFTLLEVLITLVILSVGLLGVAGMQAAGLRNNHSAYTMTQASNLAMDMIDRIRANPNGIDAYAGFDTDAATLADPGCISTGCGPADLATYDMYEWSRPLVATDNPILPAGRGVITQAGDEFIVNVLWHEVAYQGITPNKDDCVTGQAVDTACFQIRFKP